MKVYGELTKREQDVLAQFRTGARVGEVATRLAISPSTVKSHLVSIYNKTGARRRIELLAPDWDRDTIDLSHDYGLSRRQSEVLRLMLQGRSNREIARELWVSAETIKQHLSNIYDHLNVRGRYEVAAQVRHDLASADTAA